MTSVPNLIGGEGSSTTTAVSGNVEYDTTDEDDYDENGAYGEDDGEEEEEEVVMDEEEMLQMLDQVCRRIFRVCQRCAAVWGSNCARGMSTHTPVDRLVCIPLRVAHMKAPHP